ncbi:MAG: hypothetical protein LBR60_08475 [Fibrobacter sp.]|jgi:hypothetical protein|nr:hypothetical protein [Fibrobacter sp.]
MKQIALILLLFFSGIGAELPDQGACAAVKSCLQLELRRCSAEELKPLPKLKYDQAFCAPLLDLTERGLNPESGIAFEVFRHLGKPLRVVYENKGVLQVNEEMMRFLFDHLPFTAELVNAYQKTEYFIAYDSPNHRLFHGTNGGSLSGKFNWILQDSAGRGAGLHSVFFGYGGAKVLKWGLRGTAVAVLDITPVPGKKQVTYRLQTYVFPVNSILNSIMQMQAFKSVVSEKIGEIVKNIERSSAQFAKGNKKPIGKHAPFTREPYQKQLLLFEAVVSGKPWIFGDALKGKTP